MKSNAWEYMSEHAIISDAVLQMGACLLELKYLTHWILENPYLVNSEDSIGWNNCWLHVSHRTTILSSLSWFEKKIIKVNNFITINGINIKSALQWHIKQ